MTTSELQQLNQQRQTGEVQEEQAVPKKDKYGLGPIGSAVIDSLKNQSEFSGSRDYAREAAEAGMGTSRFDESNWYSPGMDIEQARAFEQSRFAKIGSGLVKGGITAGATAVNTVLGTALGLGKFFWQFMPVTVGFDLEGLPSFQEALDPAVNNSISKWTTDLQRKSDEWFPNYRTQEERSEEYQKEWYKHMGTANFIGDSFLKNFGFTVGAMGGGVVWSRLLGASMSKKLAGDILKGSVAAAEGDAVANRELQQVAEAIRNGTLETIDASKLAVSVQEAAKQLNKAEALLQLYGSAIGAMGEGNMEGLMARQEFLDDYLSQENESFMYDYENMEQTVLEEGKKTGKWVNYVPGIREDGTPGPVPQLSYTGKQEVERRRLERFNQLQERKAVAEEQGNRLASTTMLLNIPVLTASNAFQYGRMFSGGWKTARNNLAKVSGNVTASALTSTGKYTRPTIKGNYASSAGSAFWRGVGNAAKVASAESFEEMYQGAISAGTKNVAMVNMTEFNDGGYDPDATASVRDWFFDMYQGGAEYLGDVKNWQEGALGAITGLFGMPGRIWQRGNRWNGGIYQAVKDAKQTVSASESAAAALNNLVNSKEFQDRWHGYIRHLKYDNEMEMALKNDDPYSWHNANDNQIINDVIAFADAGKLEDLSQIVGAFGSMSEADAESMKAALKSDKNYSPEADKDLRNMSASTIVKRVTEQAKNLSDTIKEYRDIYSALASRAPVDASPEFLKEMVFTAMQIKKYEKRFLEMFNDTMVRIIPVIRMRAQMSEDGKQLSAESQQERFNKLRSFYEIVFGQVLPEEISQRDQQKTKDELNALYKMASGDKDTQQKIKDMKKLSDSRADYYKKLETLRGTTTQQFNEKAKTQQKEQESANKQQMKREAEIYSSVEEVKRAYRGLPADHSLDREFFESLNEIKESNPNVKAFLDLNSTYRDFIDTYEDSQFYITREHITAYNAQKFILDDLYDSASSADDVRNADMSKYLSQDPDAPTEKQAQILEKLRASAPGGLSDRAYQRAVEAVSNGLMEYNGKLNFVGPRPAPAPAQQPGGKPQGLAAAVQEMQGGQAKPPSLRAVTGTGAERRRTQSGNGKTAKDALGREWTVGQKVYLYKIDEDGDLIPSLTGEFTINDFFVKNTQDNTVQARLVSESGSRVLVDLNDKSILRMQAARLDDLEPVESEESYPVVNPGKEEISEEAVDSAGSPEFAKDVAKEVDPAAELKERGDLHYLRTGMPEIDSYAARNARSIAYDPAISEKDKKKKLADIDLRDFSEVNPDYAEVWKALQNFDGQNAFENVATVLEVNDKIEFRIDDRFPQTTLPDGTKETNILLYTKKNGRDYLLTTLVRKTSLYHGLQGLREQIFEKYNAWKSAGNTGVFVFSDENNNPITTTVFARRNGFVVYNQNDKSERYKNERGIKQISGYDENAPIVYVDRDGIHVLRGEDVPIDAIPNTSDKVGRLYYMAKGHNGYVVPIRLGVEHFNQSTKQYTAPVFEEIKSSFSAISDYVSSVADSDVSIDEERKAVRSGLTEHLKRLAKSMDIHNDIFTFYADKTTGKTMMRIYSNDIGKSYRVAADKITPEWLVSVFASRNRSLNIGRTTDIDSLIEQGLITSNAVAMRPKGVDFYMHPWDEGSREFKPYGKQKELAESSPETKDNAGSSSSKEELEKTMKEKKAGSAQAPTEKKENNEPPKPPVAPQNAPVRKINVKSTKWEDLQSETGVISDLTAMGYNQKIWDKLSEAARRNELDCLGLAF